MASPSVDQASKLADLQMAFAAHIRDPDHCPAPEAIEDRRMAIYRELFFKNVEGFLANSFPVIRKLHDDSRWQGLIRDFLVSHRAHTPLFPELPREFLKFLENHRGAEQGDPPFLLELAHYEWVELALELSEDEFQTSKPERPEALLDARLRKSPLAWLLSYNYPVHQIRPDFQPTEPAAAATHLVAYRGADDSVKFLELNAVSARLLYLIDQSDTAGADQGTATGRDHLAMIASELGAAFDEKFIRAGVSMLADLADRDIIGCISQT